MLNSRTIEAEPKERVEPLAATILVASFAVFSILPIAPAAWSPAMRVLGGVLAIGALYTRNPATVHVALFTAIAPLCAWLLPDWVIWPFPYALALILYVALARAYPALGWFRRGRVEWWLIAATVVVSSTALI